MKCQVNIGDRLKRRVYRKLSTTLPKFIVNNTRVYQEGQHIQVGMTMCLMRMESPMHIAQRDRVQCKNRTLQRLTKLVFCDLPDVKG